MQNAQVGDPGLAHFFQQVQGDFVRRFSHDFAGLGVDHVLREEQPDDRLRVHFHVFKAGFTEETPIAAGDGLASLDQNLALGVDDIRERGFLAVHVLLDLPQQAFAIQAILFFFIEGIEDLGLAHAHGFKQNGRGHFAAAVDADIQNVLVVEVKVEPRTAHGNNAAGIEHLAGGMSLAAVVLEDNAGRALKLVDDNALGTIDDEGALFGHQRQSAEVDILFLAVAEGAVARAFFHVVHVETHLDAHRSFVGQPLGDALRLVVLGLADFIAQVFKTGGAVEVLNGEDGTEYALQPHLGVAILASFLQKDAVRVHLKVEQVRYGERHLDFSELLCQLLHRYSSG